MTEPVQVRVHAIYEWDCPGCGEVHGEGDIEPASGSTAECYCGEMVVFE